MKLKKIVAAIAAAAMAVSMTAINAFAATVAMNSEYAGAWGASAGIPKSEFAAIGGDVKVVITMETKKPLVGDANYLAKPMNMCASWDAITFNGITSDTAVVKSDGFFVLQEGQTSLEFVVPESVWSTLVDYSGTGDTAEAALYFHANDVILKSAELSAGAAQGELRTVTEEQSALIMGGASYEEVTAPAEEAPAEDATTEEAAPAEEAAEETTEEAAPAEEEVVAEETTEEAAPAETEAPAADTTTAPVATGNVAVASIAAVMAVAGAAAIVSKKRN